MSEDKRIHVLMVSMSLQGHINPMFKFAKHLLSKGVHVTIATTEDGRDGMLKNTKPSNLTKSTNINNSHNSNNDSGIDLVFFSDGLDLDFDRSDTESLVNTIRENGPKNLSTLITDLTKVHNYSCVIVNPFVPWAIDVVVEHGIPCALLWIQACAAYSIYYRYLKNINPFPNMDDLDEKVHLPGLPPFEVRDSPSFILPSTPYHFRTVIRELFQAMDKVSWVIGTSCYEIEEEIVNSMASLTPIYPVGPLVSPFLLGEKERSDVSVDMWIPEDSCIEWLETMPDSSVIYVSFGSLLSLSQKQVGNIAMALKNSNKAFLWVIKPCKGESNNVAELPVEFLEETKVRGLVVKWCPQEKVLMHPSVACFVTHCGWNSTLETLVTGVPVIAWPFWSDQATNAMLMEKVFRNGVRVKYGEDGIVETEEIERCIKDVTEGPRAEELKKRAMKMKELARKTLQEDGTSNKNINKFITELIVGNPARA
ncbi:UDP-glycosyltransferase 84B2-like [Vigna radiata var. radiata]|uniref:Glycosyltransferase n=1 Tax=Vigna radiata var. radiata TaxID=3916 RepID=A0A1S3UKM9_VIGRR|nr:UDP-glycosyltransferase 84B2-like [Vigna radiata var. radiata]